MKYTVDTLAEVIAQVVHFSMDDFSGSSDNEYPEQVAWNVSYQVACFLAQHTLHGGNGVETDVAMDLLQVGKFMPYIERVELARKAILQHTV